MLGGRATGEWVALAARNVGEYARRYWGPIEKTGGKRQRFPWVTGSGALRDLEQAARYRFIRLEAHGRSGQFERNWCPASAPNVRRP